MIESSETLKGSVKATQTLNGTLNVGSGSGTNNYEEINNKPQINNVELIGNKTSSELGLQEELESGTNIKTINNQSLLGSGNIEIAGSSSSERNIMILQTSDVHRVENGGYVKFNRVKCSIGDKLSYVEGTKGVTIGKGVSKIFVSFTINICSSARQWFTLRRSKENTGICCMGKSGADNYTTLCVSPALLFVEEGDLIEVASQSSGAGTVNQDLGTNDTTYMTVEVLE